MTFYSFMMKNHVKGNGRKSDLAYDMKSDKSYFPKNSQGKYDGWHNVIREYLTNKGACYDALEVFEECWKEYLNCEKNK